jgi:hypothetical protein
LVVTDLSDRGYEVPVPHYAPESFYDDIMSQTSGWVNPDLTRTVVNRAGSTLKWLTEDTVERGMEPLAVGYAAGWT